MSAIIETRDIPRENLFRIGIVQEVTTRDLFVIATPRKPFIVNRAEALNIIGHIVTKADFTVDDIENTIKMWKPEYNIFEVRGDDVRAWIETPTKARVFTPTQSDFVREALYTAAAMGLFLFGAEEGKILCASLVRVMDLKPREVDAGVVAIFDHSRNPSGEGETEADLRKATPPVIKPVS